MIFGSSEDMRELPDSSVSLVVTSPPYFNAPFDFPNMFASYDDFLQMISRVGREIARVLQPGRIASFVTQDVRIGGKLYPIVADIITLMTKEAGLIYQEKIIWKKPEGYVRISRRSGVLVQRPYPMYYYPDNVFEELLVFRKPGTFPRSQVLEEVRSKSKIDLERFLKEKWYLSIWEIANVLPSERWSSYSPFPEELVDRLIRLYSYVSETVLDPFLGTGTTCLVAARLGRRCVGYEVDLELAEAVRERLGEVEIKVREDAKRLRSSLNEEIKRRLRA
ncbi:MAG: site-specific DNA-methyltransferase [Acidilobaceae archaeon]|nr:site-specific DNA-methyltransferase [Acidilobaceae archaeon]MDW7974616.1 site-specific DNA-methyltransferase [Sulfolobales archaeon]